MKALYRFFISLNTLFAIFTVSIALALAGSLTLPRHLAFFSGIDDTPLFLWLQEASDPWATWWIYVFIGTLTFMTVSMIFCTADDLLKGLSRQELIKKLSPQVIHIGTLFVLLGYLLTSAYGTRTDVLVKKGEEGSLSPSVSVYLENLGVKTDEQGYFIDWEASLRLVEGDKAVDVKVLRPVHPVYFGGYGLYFKSISMGDEPAALIRVCRDPGAGWALLGGSLLLIGATGALYSRFRP
jgi:hypothetical protein